MKNMNIAEFSRAVSLYQRKSLLACLLPLAAALASLLVYAPFQSRFQSFLSSRFEAGTVDVLCVAPMALPTALAFLAMIPLGRRVERKWGIACQWCGKGLGNHKPVVIASRNCPHCGKRVIELEAQDTTLSPGR